MQRVYDDRKTPQLVEQLKTHWQDQARHDSPTLYRDYDEDEFYPANIFFDQGPTQTALDYGVAAPGRSQRRHLSFKAICCWILFWVVIGELILIFSPIW